MKKEKPVDSVEEQVAAARMWATRPVHEIPTFVGRVIGRAKKPGEYQPAYTVARILAEELDRRDNVAGDS